LVVATSTFSWGVAKEVVDNSSIIELGNIENTEMIEAYITGSNGFLGQKLAQRFVEPQKIPHQEIDSITLKPFRYFFFLSSYGNMPFHKEDDKIIKANILDPIRMISQASKLGFKSFLFVSTSSVKLKHQTMYSRTKKATEEVMLSYAEKHGLPVCIIRPYSITGVGEQKEHLIPTLIRSCLAGEPMNFVPEPCHDYIDVEDVVDAMMNLSVWKARGIYEIGTGKTYLNQDVLEIVEKITGKKANTTIVSNMRSYDTNDWMCRNFRARGYGWLPQKSLEQSIKEMVDYYKKNERTGKKDH